MKVKQPPKRACSTLLLIIASIFIGLFVIYIKSWWQEVKDTVKTYQSPISLDILHKTFSATTTNHNRTYYVTASWYDYDLPDAPNYSKKHNTCASRTYPRETMVKVTNSLTGKSVICRVNDYGPEEQTKRGIDLSSHAFKQIAPLKQGLVEVTTQEVETQNTP